MKRIYCNVMAEEIRMAITNDKNELIEMVYERDTIANRVNHIYKGVVKNVLPGMSSAFVDIGIGQNAYLNMKDGNPKDRRKLHVGQTMMVQIVKEEMHGKGVRVSADVSLAGHYMVLLPYSSGVHISKKITDTATREAFKELAKPYLAQGGGFIIRTAALKASREEIDRDMAFLHQTWEQLSKRYDRAKNGTELYRDADFWFRLIRDYMSSDVGEIVVDNFEAYERLRFLLGNGHYGESTLVSLHMSREPIFQVAHIESQIDELLSNRIELPSGGEIQIDYTEALTVIDVNSARYSGALKGPGAVAKAVNWEAATMIARQLVLRNMGGIIICDFIDMKSKEDQEALLAYLTSLTRQDPVKTVVVGMSSLGLVEITRKRESKGVESILYDTCDHCGGTGRIVSSETMYIQILRHLRELAKGGRLKTDVLIEVSPSVAKYFTKSIVASLHQELNRLVTVEANEQMNREAYSILANE